jgi:prepilin-type N-terminal cleavage/methylation domain-containing protein
MVFLTRQVIQMIRLVKKFNEHKRITAFSLIEILTVLAIVAIILTVPNWAVCENRLLKTAEDRLALTQTKIDMALLRQARSSSEQIIEVSLKPLCNSEEISIYLGGWTEPKKLICKNKDVEIDALGLLSFKDPS